VPVDRAHADARRARDVVHLRVAAEGREGLARREQDAVAVAPGVGAHAALGRRVR
jgi:hypothetical protein